MAPKARAANALRSLLADGHICLSCRRNLNLPPIPYQARTYASAATAPASDSAADPSPPPPTSSNKTTPTTSLTPKTKPIYTLHAGILLTRAPIITRPLHPFESAFFLYQRRLNERLALPFTKYFYFKKGTPADLEWKRKIKDRTTPARDIGRYNTYADVGWDDEVKIGEPLGVDLEGETRKRLMRDVDEQADVGDEGVGAAEDLPTSGEKGALKGAEGQKDVDPVKKASEAVQAQVTRRRGAIEVEKPAERVGKADRDGDMQSLDRAAWRTLHLLVRNKEGGWQFPSVKLAGRENLRQGAERALLQAAGANMNTWMVGNVPVGHLVRNNGTATNDAESGMTTLGEKTFFLKGRIMAGQANLAQNQLGLTEYKWLTKEEIKEHLHPAYYSHVENMMGAR